MVSVLCIGEALIVLSPVAGEPVDVATTFEASVAGAELNVAVNLRAQGLDVAWAGPLGDDPFGTRIVDELRARGVDVLCAQQLKGAFTGLVVKPGDGGLVRYYRRGSAGSRLSPDLVNRVAGEVAPRIVHVTGVSAQISESGFEALSHLMRSRPFGDALVSFDVNHRAALADTGTAGRLFELAGRADIVFVGLDEAAAVWGTTTVEQVRDLLPHVPWLVVKDAETVAVEYHADEVVRVVPGPVDIVEPTGAGDAFAAGWLGAFLERRPASERLESGHREASAVLRSRQDHVTNDLADAPFGSRA
jgi:2-dehydro-3-deoxygluconokinase